MPSMPQEYTPEMTEDFYNKLARPLEERTAANVGKARSEALSRGLEGDPFEASAVGAARTAGTNALSDLWANIGMQGAGMAREERMTGEGRDWQGGQAQLGREFQSTENEKLRAFQQQMAELDRANQRRIAEENSSGWGDVLGTAAGMFTGGLGAGAAKAITKGW